MADVRIYHPKQDRTMMVSKEVAESGSLRRKGWVIQDEGYEKSSPKPTQTEDERFQEVDDLETPFDINDKSVREIKKEIKDIDSVDVLQLLKTEEMEGKDRTTPKKDINNRISEIQNQ